MYLSDENVAKLRRVDQWFQGWSPPPGITHRVSRNESQRMVTIHLRRTTGELALEDVDFWGDDLWDVDDPLTAAREMVTKAVDELLGRAG